ncbi:hypothetical protein J3A83DRAFT_4196225 [Scleroderma citrinum]
MTVFDAQAVACKEHWTYERDYAYAICIPQKDSILSLKITWYMPTANDFIIPTDSKFTCTLLDIYAMLNSARERASAGPSRGGEEKWEEPDLAEILKPHSLFTSAWKQADKDLERIKSDLVDPGYCFPKPTILASMLTSARKKTYLFNWLSTCSLWISQVNVHQPTKFLFPQMWRDFLNTIDTNQPNQPASTKSALRNWQFGIFWGLAEAPEEVMWQGMQSLLWELYELNFCYEFYALDQAIIPHLWTSSDKAQIAHQILLYSIFPGVSGLVMWLEPLPQDGHGLGLCAMDMSIALPFLNNFHELLSTWPGAPPHLQLPAKLDGRENMAVHKLFVLAAQFYVQTAFDFLE